MYGDRDNNQGNDAGKFQFPNTGCGNIANDNNAEATMKRFSCRLKAMRVNKGLSCRTLSELCGLSRNMIAEYESGRKKPTLPNLVTIAAYFEVSIDYMLGTDKEGKR